MTKKEEINKNNNIIIGIAAFAIIAIAIIVAINFFTPRSHAKVDDKRFDAVAMSTVKQFDSKQLKTAGKVFKFQKSYQSHKAAFDGPKFVKSFDEFAKKEKGNDLMVAFFGGDKSTFDLVPAKNKGPKSFDRFKKDSSFVKDFFENAQS